MDVSTSPVPGASPIGELPVEILTRVFSHLPERPDGPTGQSSLYVSHVCRYWRAVALNFKALWTIITYRSQLDWIKVLLERSDPIPLRVWINRELPCGAKFYEKAQFILQALPRIEELIIEFVDSEKEIHLQGKLGLLALLDKCPAPLLRSLKIALGETLYIKDAVFPTMFSGITPPELHKLELSDCIVPQSFHLFKAPLTHVEFVRCEGWTTIDQFLDVLSQVPMLQTFIHCAEGIEQQIREFDTTRPDHSITLPNLTRLDFNDTVVVTAHILRYFDLPPSVNVTIQVTEDLWESDIAPQATADMFDVGLRPHLASAWSQGGKFGICALQLLEGTDEKGFTLTAVRPEGSPDEPGLDLRPSRFKFSLRTFAKDDPDPQLSIPIIHMLARLPGVAEPETVLVHQYYLMTKGAHWRGVAEAWGSVNAITLVGEAVHGLAEALSGDGASALFPELSVLIIKDANLNADRPNEDDHGASASEGDACMGNGVPVIDRLAAAVARRVVRGCPPVAFMIEECDVTPARVQTLKQAAEAGLRVMWDKKQNAWTEKDRARRRVKRERAARERAVVMQAIGLLEGHTEIEDEDEEEEWEENEETDEEEE